MENEKLMPDIVTIDITDSNDIHIPIEWNGKLEFNIRSFGLLGVRVPKQLLKRLNIENGGKADLFLEENCVLIRKNTEAALKISQPEPPEPQMAFFCVCGNLLYTNNGLFKVLSKHICCECVELVKLL